jgi:translation initiation factor IF-3
VRVIADDGQQVGILPLAEAIRMAQSRGVDLVEVAPNASPPVCRLVDYGKYRYEQSKRDKESRKHQHANKMKEVQLSPSIDPHDYGVKLSHAIDFLCEEMKVKISLRFRGREMAHTEFGFQVVQRFIEDLGPYAHPDAAPKLVGRGIHVMMSPLPRNKRAKNPNQAGSQVQPHTSPGPLLEIQREPEASRDKAPRPAEGNRSSSQEGFLNNPFSQIDIKLAQ